MKRALLILKAVLTQLRRWSLLAKDSEGEASLGRKGKTMRRK
jgi:hypothetical protein